MSTETPNWNRFLEKNLGSNYPPLTTAITDILADARQIARINGDNWTGSEHVCLAILKAGRFGGLSELFKQHGITTEDLFDQFAVFSRPERRLAVLEFLQGESISQHQLQPAETST